VQFSLRSILLCIVLLSLYFGLAFATPPTIAIIGLVLLSAVMLPAIVGGIIYARASWRAFWIGCATGAFPLGFFWWYIMLLGSFIPVNQGEESKTGIYYLAAFHCLVIVDGVIVVVVRWLCVRRSNDGSIALQTASGSEAENRTAQ
jgi:hypothetical protein